MNTATLDTYESLVDYARSISEGIDERRWSLGDVCNVAMERFGEKSIAEIAKDIGQRKSSLYQYSAVSRFYSQSNREHIREVLPNISYTMLRDAMRLNSVYSLSVLSWLEEISDNSWTADEASRRLTERLGHETRDSIEGLVSSGSLLMNGHRYIEILVYNDDQRIKLETGATVVIRVK